MGQFFKHLLVFSLVPLSLVALLVGYYVYADPFKVIGRYADYSYPDVIPNRDVISTRSFIDRYEKEQYNAFIFGSSRTLGFKASSWKRYLNEQAKPFVFDASSESAAGICQKLRYLDEQHVQVNDALIVLCRDCSFMKTIDDQRHLIIKDPEVSKKSNWKFHWSFLKAYFDNKFLWRYLAYQASGSYKDWMRGYLEYRKISYDLHTNELRIIDQEEEITRDETAYYEKRRPIFYERKGEKIDSLPVIDAEGRKCLEDIKALLDKQGTRYEVVLSPLYEQIKYHPADKHFLESLFGRRLHDFTGKNTFTDSYRNYYETSHFRPSVGDSILSLLYAEPKHQ